MHFNKLLLGSALSAALIAAPFSPALAGWHHHGGGRGFRGPFGLVGALVVGAAAIATAPIAILASAGSRGPGGDARGYSRYGDGDAQGGYYRQADNAPPPGYYGGRQAYRNAPPRGYAPTQQQADEGYYARDRRGFDDSADSGGYQMRPQPRRYAASDNYGDQPRSAYNDGAAGYGPPRQSPYYGPRNYDYQQQRYAQRPDYDAPPPGY